MAALISKRQQARNEKALQDLMHNGPGNNLCADCGQRNPAWSSWSLGIFLCMRCATIHRKLGTHISKVKSLSMDGWTNDQVESMKRVGNLASNKIYNPSNKKPPIPIDADEADSAMERFIRAKYTQKNSSNKAKAMARQNSGSSSEGTPPPPPPKTGSKFFKATKSPKSPKSHTFPLFGRSKKPAPRSEKGRDDFRPKPITTASTDSADETARKLGQLRDMGFPDEKRNRLILNMVHGSLEKAIEALVRLGDGKEGASLSAPALSAQRDNSFSSSNARSLTPGPPATPTSAGLSLQTTATSPPSSRSPANSKNPFDVPRVALASSHSTGNLSLDKNPFFATNFNANANANTNANTNPFHNLQTQQASMNLSQSMQNLSLATPQQQQQQLQQQQQQQQPQQHQQSQHLHQQQQPLFPHHTGPMPNPPSIQQQPLYQQSLTPPIPQLPNFHGNSNGHMFPIIQTHPQPSPLHQQHTGYNNPFLPSPQSMPSTSPVQSHMTGSNPFARSPTRIASPALGKIPEQVQQNFYRSPPQSPDAGNNPFFAGIQQQQQQQQQPSPFAQSQVSSPFGQPQPQLQQQQQPSSPFGQPQQVSSPFGQLRQKQHTPQPQQQQAQPFFQQPTRQQQQSPFDQIQAQSQPQQQFPFNPIQRQQSQPQQLPQQQFPFNQQVQQQPQSQPQSQQQMPYQQLPQPQTLTPRGVDKSSILALYGQPTPTQISPLSSQQLPQQQQQQQPQQQTISQQHQEIQPSPSAAMAIASNPFAGLDDGIRRPVGSRESVMLGMEMAWGNGRHSPDAFASLSARSG